LRSPRIGQISRLTEDVRWRYKRPIGVQGTRVYFTGVPRGLFAIGKSGEIETVPLVVPWSSDQEVWATEVSPDGTYFLALPINSDQLHPLWIFTTTGKPVRYVAEMPWPLWSVGWSPDSKQVIYSTADGKVYTVPTTSGEPCLLFTSPYEPPTNFSWSPDGTRIRFSRGGKIWEITSNGSNLHEFLPGMKDSVTKCCGRWTPDGAFYIFASAMRIPRHYLEDMQLWALDERSGRLQKPSRRPVQLTSAPMYWMWPVISPDSRTIFATGTNRQGELVHFDTRIRQFERYLGGISADGLSFSPDGKYVAYITYPDRKIWRANRDGSGRILLAEPEGTPFDLRWTPDGTKILLTVGPKVYLVPSQGGRLEQLRFPKGENPMDPTWSPDGKRLVYTIDSNDQHTPNGIRILDLETNRSIALPRAGAPLWSPRWSPDGRYVFCAAEPDSAAVFDTEKQRWIYFPAKLDVNFPNWAHDSRSVYFLGSPASMTSMMFSGVYRISIPSGHIERVVGVENARLASSGIGYWLGLDPEDHPLLLRDAGSVEIYALTLER